MTPFSAELPFQDLSGQISQFQKRARNLTGQAAEELSELSYTDPQSSAHPALNSSPVLYGVDGLASNVPRSLIGTESGGNWQATNNERGSSGRKGHYGFLQFGHDRLDDARRAGIIPKNMTAEAFVAKGNEQYQVAAANWHFADIDNRIRKAGYDQLIGQTVGGVSMTWDGMRSMAHLGGFGGLSNFIQSHGSYNPSDSFGTSIAAYGRRHGS